MVVLISTTLHFNIHVLHPVFILDNIKKMNTTKHPHMEHLRPKFCINYCELLLRISRTLKGSSQH